jgi:Acetyltransferase (GNAT) domain
MNWRFGIPLVRLDALLLYRRWGHAHLGSPQERQASLTGALTSGRDRQRPRNETAAIDSSYTFRRMCEAEKEDAKRFLLEHFDEGSHQNLPGWFEWQHVNNPDGSHIQLCLRDNRIVAMSGFIPCKVLIRGQVYSGAFSTSTMVDASHQGRGIGGRIHSIRLDDYDFALSSGQSPANFKLYMKMGWRIYGYYYRLLLRKEFPRPYVNKTYLKAVWSWFFWFMRTAFKEKKFCVEATRDIPEGIDAFFKRFDQKSIGLLRNVDYLRWRYKDHPYLNYEFIKVFRQKTLIGFAVVRESDSAKVLVDVYCKNEDFVDLLTGLGMNLKTKMIVGLVAGPSLKKVFNRAGWCAFRERSCLVGKSNAAVLENLVSDGSWCLFGGDSDKDR